MIQIHSNESGNKKGRITRPSFEVRRRGDYPRSSSANFSVLSFQSSASASGPLVLVMEAQVLANSTFKPVNAIYAEEDVPDNQKHFTDLNVELAKTWASITKTKGPLADADDWKDQTEKLALLDRG